MKCPFWIVVLMQSATEERSPSPFAIIVLGLLVAYYMSQPSSRLLKPLILLLSSIIGIIATYILFDAGLIVFYPSCKRIRSCSINQRTFISWSQTLQFRMRKMRQDLQRVRILSTMVLVTMATTVALNGTTARLDSNYPTDYSCSCLLCSRKRIWINILQSFKN